MKRSGFKPKPGVYSSFKRKDGEYSSFGKSSAPKQHKQMRSKPKAIPAHELAHYKRVAALPCVKCGLEKHSQCAHSNRAKDGKGGSIKAHYLATFPLCCTRPGVRGCHVEHDQLIGMTKEQADDATVLYIAHTHEKLNITKEVCDEQGYELQS